MPNSRRTPKSNPNACDTSDLVDAESGSLQHEISLLRMMIRRTMQLADGIDDLKDAMRLLDALGSAAGRLANLLRVQKSLREFRSPLADEISLAIQQVNTELRRKDG